MLLEVKAGTVEKAMGATSSTVAEIATETGLSFDTASRFDRIAAERTRVGMTQEQLADKIGVAKKTMSKYEDNPGDIPARHLFIISDTFGVSIDYLVGRDSDRKAG